MDTSRRIQGCRNPMLTAFLSTFALFLTIRLLEARGEGGRMPAIGLQDTHPPSISFLELRPLATSAGKKIRLRLRIQDDVAVRSAHWANSSVVDPAGKYLTESIQLRFDGVWEGEIPLANGPNSIVIAAEDSSKKGMLALLIVEATGDATPPEPPTDPTAKAVSQDRIDLAWTGDLQDGEIFQVERSVDGGDSQALVALNRPRYVDNETLEVGRSYRYRIRTIDREGNASLYAATEPILIHADTPEPSLDREDDPQRPESEGTDRQEGCGSVGFDVLLPLGLLWLFGVLRERVVF